MHSTNQLYSVVYLNWKLFSHLKCHFICYGKSCLPPFLFLADFRTRSCFSLSVLPVCITRKSDLRNLSVPNMSVDLKKIFFLLKVTFDIWFLELISSSKKLLEKLPTFSYLICLVYFSPWPTLSFCLADICREVIVPSCIKKILHFAFGR